MLIQEAGLHLGARCCLKVRLIFQIDDSQDLEKKHSWVVKLAKAHLAF